MILRHLEYLTALARERHFARAASACGVTQSTLSAGIKQMEDSLGVLLVERGQRFRGLTPEGEKALEWAQHVIVDYDGLQQCLTEMRTGLSGQLRIGAIPVTLPVVSLLTAPFAAKYPDIRALIRSLTSVEIQRGIDDISLDVGVTYLDNEPLARVRMSRLYTERYVLITHERRIRKKVRTISWAEAATHPLCLLTPDMQNRRIIDMHFREAGAKVQAVVETNSVLTLWSYLRFGDYSAIVPHTFLLLLDKMDELQALPLVEPDASHVVGVVASEREPLPPLTRTFLDLANKLNLEREITRRLDQMRLR
ncbi:MAG: LysR family transcriptional regulator [Acidobacteriota bacterium]